MRFHRPGRPEDLPHPDVLWVHGGLLACVEAASGGHRPDRSVRGGVLRCGRGAGWWLLARVEGGRAALLGVDHDLSAVQGDGRPVDLLAEMPEWLPWDRLPGEFRDPAELGFAYWWEEGSWHRPAYPDDWEDDGVRGPLADCTEEADFIGLLAGAVRPVRGREADAEAAARQVVQRARRGELDPEAIGELCRTAGMAAPETGAAAETAGRLGFLPGIPAEEAPLAAVRPERPPFPLISQEEQMFLLRHEMRTAAELGPGNPEAPAELDRVAAWMRENVLQPGGSAVLVTAATQAAWITGPDREGPVFYKELAGLVQELHRAESDPERGGWLYLRLEVTADEARAERAWDRFPAWAHGLGNVIALHRARTGRSVRWTPHWVGLADGAVLHAPPAPTPVRERGEPAPAPGGEHRVLEGAVREALWGDASDDVQEFRVSWRALVGYRGGEVRAVRTGEEESGRAEPVPVPDGLRKAMTALREACYRPGRGTWFSAEVRVPRDGACTASYDHDTEPPFHRAPAPFSYALDAAYFPRSAEHTPGWLAAHLHRAGYAAG
ncbi:hypothetical protein [Nocardiopsis potens]|uniref:hypothetical protein n=1 Tax=Nocardiopsis potens TaxID=1246458 RepID=UPI00034BB9B2|nr:hypothetical protein [Nocardiopsis potens]